MSYDVRIEDAPAGRHLAVVRLRASQRDLPRVIPAACGTVWGAIKARQVSGAGRHVAVYFDGEINLEVGVELESPYADDGGQDDHGCQVVASTLPVGRAATATHFGPYGGLGAAHRAIADWCAQRGHAMAGPSWEVYGHWLDEWNRDPSQIRTDVFYLLKDGA